MQSLGRFSMGIGDRFGLQGVAQLAALRKAGVAVTPVWNKSFREHSIVGTTPADTRRASDTAVQAASWRAPYFLDADHIGLGNVDRFIAPCDFFTLDVAEEIGKAADPAASAAFVAACGKYAGTLRIPGIDRPFEVTREVLQAIAGKYLTAILHAAAIYRHIVAAKAGAPFIVEVSMDESAAPQTPLELLFILAGLGREGVPVNTIAPKFSGRFNKGVDYVGDVARFAREFEDDVAVVAYAIETFGLPKDMKLSVHSGSDKFSLYRPIGKTLKKMNAGVHLKTAGTTWLEELAGLAAAGGEGLAIAQDVYEQAYARFDEMCAPYASVIDIDRTKLPAPAAVRAWTSREFVEAVRHEQDATGFNPHMRQLLHVGYKIAAEMGSSYIEAIRTNATVIGEHVTDNLYRKHLVPLLEGIA